MTKVDANRKVRPVLSDAEFEDMLAQAREHACTFLAIRDPAILCMLRITGKRRDEIAGVMRRDVYLGDDNLAINFMLLKKRHRKVLPDGTIIPAGPPPTKIRYIPLKDPFVIPIIGYMKYVERLYPDTDQFWLHVRPVFGNYHVIPSRGIQGRQVYNVVRKNGDLAGVTVWPHLFRETAGAEEVMKDPTLFGVYKVARRIDVTEQTAWNYMERYVMSVIDRETKEHEKQQR